MTDVGLFPDMFLGRRRLYQGHLVIDDNIPIQDYSLEQTAAIISFITDHLHTDDFVYPIFKLDISRITSLDLEPSRTIKFMHEGGLLKVDTASFTGHVSVLSRHDERLKNFLSLTAFHRTFLEDRVNETMKNIY